MDLKDKEKIVQLIGAAESAYQQLENKIHTSEAKGKTPAKTDQQLYTSISRALDKLKEKPFAGQKIPRKNWPKNYLSEFPNLFRMELSQGWRLLYYVMGDKVKVVSVVFECCDHKHYDKILGYKSK